MPILTNNNQVLTAGGKVLIREASPLDLPNLKLYLSATRMPQYADGTAIPSFLDYSGNNYNATQASGTLQPKFETNEFGTNAGIKGDGVDDIMDVLTPSALDVFRNINQFTVQCLIKRSVISASGYPLNVFDNSGTLFRFIVFFTTSGNLTVGHKTLDSDIRSDITTPSNDLLPHFLQVTLNAGILYMYLDGFYTGSTVVTSGQSSNTACNKLTLFNATSGTQSNVIINGISINTLYSDPSTIQAQYRGYLQRGYL